MKRLFFLSIFLLSYSMVAMNAALVFASGSSEVQANQSQGNSPLSLSGLALKEVAYLHAQQKLADADLDCLRNKEAGILIDDLPGFSLTASRDLNRLSISLSRYLQKNSDDWKAAYLSIHWPENLVGLEKWEKLCRSSLSNEHLIELEELKKIEPSFLKNSTHARFGDSLFYNHVLLNAGFYEKENVIWYLQNLVQKAVESGNGKIYFYLKILLDQVATIQSIQKQSKVEFLPSAHYELLLDRGLSEKAKKTLLQKIMKECNFDETNYLVGEFYDNDVKKWWPENAREREILNWLGTTVYTIPFLDSIHKDIVGYKGDEVEIVKKLCAYTNENKVIQYVFSLCKQQRFTNAVVIFKKGLIDPIDFLLPFIAKNSFEDIKRNLWPLIHLLNIQFEELASLLDDKALRIKCFKLFYGETATIKKIQEDLKSSLNDLDKLQQLRNLDSLDLKKAIHGINDSCVYPSPIQIALDQENKKLLNRLLQMGFKVPKDHLKYLKLSQYPGELIQMAMQYDALPTGSLESAISHIFVKEHSLYEHGISDIIKICELGLVRPSDINTQNALTKLINTLLKEDNFDDAETILKMQVLDLDQLYTNNFFLQTRKGLINIDNIPSLKAYEKEKLKKQKFERKKRYFKATMAAVGVGIFSYVGYQWLKGYFSAD